MTVDTITSSSRTLTLPTPPAITDTTSAALDRLRDWVTAAAHAHQLVAPLVNTPFVPDAYKPKVDPRATDDEKRAAYETAVATATAAVLQGISLGLDPLTSLQQIYVVHGRPGMYAKMMVALVQSKGHEVWTEDNTETRAVVAGRRRGTDAVERVTITMDMARKAGWTKNGTYQATPADMLWARAAARVCDRIASDVLKGLATVEDIETDRAVESAPAGRTVASPRPARAVTAAQQAAPAAPAQQGARQTAPAAQQAPAGMPPLPGEDDQPPATGQGHQAPAITDSQQRALGATFAELGVKGEGERANRLAVVRAIVGREDVTSARDLTRDEAATVLDTLAANGPAIVADVLGQPAPAAADHGDTTADEFDPTADDAWGTDQ